MKRFLSQVLIYLTVQNESGLPAEKKTENTVTSIAYY